MNVVPIVQHEASGQAEYYRRLQVARRRILTDELNRQGGNRTRTAKALGLQRTYLLRLLRETGLQDYTRSQWVVLQRSGR